MPDHGTHGHASGPVPDIDELRRMGYETDDIGTKTIAIWAALLFGFVAFCLALTYFVYLVFVPGDNAQQEAYVQFPLTGQQRLPPPDAPILQAYPKQDWKNFTRAEDEKVHTYGWVDRNKGVVQIPIERAIELTVERGIPTPASRGTTNSNSPGSVPGRGLTPQPGLSIATPSAAGNTR